MKNTTLVLKYLIYIGLFAIPFIAFIVPSGMFFPFITGKGFAFRILVEVLFGLYVILASFAPEFRPKMSWLTKAVGIFVLTTLIADLLSANVFKSLWSNYERMEGFVLIIHLALYYIVASSVLNNKLWNYFWDMNIAASVIMSGYALLQFAGKITIDQGGSRLDGTFGNSAYYAIYLVFNIFLCFYMIVQIGKPKWQKWVYGIIAVVETILLYYTATRGAILGFIGGLVIMGLLIIFKEKQNVKLRKYAYGTLIGILVLCIGFIAIRNTPFVQKSPVLVRFATLSFSELQTQGRYFVWPMAVKGILERPVFGWGQESFNYVFNKNYDPRMYAQEQWFDRSHDVVLDWFINAGIVGFLAYASMFLALLYYVWRKESSLTVTEKALLTGLVSAYVFHNIFVFDNLISYILFFSVLAFVHTISTLRTTPVGKFYTFKFSDDVLNYAIIPVIAIVTLGAVYFVNVPAISANMTLISAITPPQTGGGVEENLKSFKQVFAYNSFGSSEALEQLTQFSSQIAFSSQVPDTLKQQFYDFTKTQIEKKVAETPHDARYLAFAGSFFNRFGQYYDSIGQNATATAQYNTAITYMNRAILESPKKQTMYYELANSYINLKDYTKAFDILKQAYNLETDSGESRIYYAVGAIFSKNADALKMIAPQIASTTIISDNRFLQAYASIGDYQSVINILNTRIQNEPTNLQFRLSLASAYLQIGQKQKAIDILNEMIKMDPTFKAQGEGYIKQIQAQ